MAEELKPNSTPDYVDIRSGQVVLTVKCARDLPAVDAGGTSDPYVITRLETPQGKSEKMKTKGKQRP
jgi:Ca2+-dependent lipid-binding protein